MVHGGCLQHVWPRYGRSMVHGGCPAIGLDRWIDRLVGGLCGLCGLCVVSRALSLSLSLCWPTALLLL